MGLALRRGRIEYEPPAAVDPGVQARVAACLYAWYTRRLEAALSRGRRRRGRKGPMRVQVSNEAGTAGYASASPPGRALVLLSLASPTTALEAYKALLCASGFSVPVAASFELADPRAAALELVRVARRAGWVRGQGEGDQLEAALEACRAWAEADPVASVVVRHAWEQGAAAAAYADGDRDERLRRYRKPCPSRMLHYVASDPAAPFLAIHAYDARYVRRP